jgi:hypothetical protein
MMASVLAATIARGDAMLFTGAGFSSDARDLEGNPLPDGRQMVAELWPLVFGDAEIDDSSLPDLYDAALLLANGSLSDYLMRRLRVGDAPLPAHYAKWFSAPWRRIYTLNVDDLECAVQRQFRLPRALRSVSAIAPDRSPAREDGAIDVVHLNGLAGADATGLTFSTMQYAARLCARDREYECLAQDLHAAPFVFAGTTLDEVVLWQHLELQRMQRGEIAARPRSFLVSSSLSRARRVLLESLQIQWIQGTIAELADQLF